VRSHFAAPVLAAARWRLRVGGLVDRPHRLSLPELLRLPAHSTTVTLECAGNGRSLMRPATGGEQWGLGAVATAIWTGVLLEEVLERAGLRSEAREVVFRGADGFERSLALEDVRGSEILLAYAMNDQPLPVAHGCPLRVVVPGWYAVADVKWLTEVMAIDHPFRGRFQAHKYVYEQEVQGRLRREPVRLQRVRALITEPAPGQVVGDGLAVRGLAWSGAAPIARVEVSLDGGAWLPARLLGAGDRHSWRRWELVSRVERPAPARVRARATDAAGATQPDRAAWNRLGYGNNAIQEVAFRSE
jgi:DMSO/TMAO reductase YedYZ molybdopterin-dependent catalytic subunit